MENRKATIKDIAKKLGISASTVSRALNDKFVKNDEMVALIKKTAEEMDYQVNTIAAGLRTRKSNLIGIVVPRIASNFFSSVLAGIQSVLNSSGYNVLICQSNESKELEEQQVNSLIRCNVEGLMISCSQQTHSEEFFDRIVSKGLKLVYFDRKNFETDRPVVKIDDIHGAFLATEHLVKNDAKKLAFIGGPEELSICKDRFDGYVNAIAELEVESVGSFFVDSKKEIKAVVEKLLKSKNRPEGIVTWSDDWGVQTILAAQAIGLKVPDDLMVTGYDNTEVCTIVQPNLTSMVHEAEAIGQSAAQTLLDMIKGESVTTEKLMETHLVERGSSAK
ncbi:MAG: LacI family DNA-binding transcriptional regulator [Bacteroidota bacterium]